jgi:uncharacterized protein (DUF2235 family)
MPAKPVSFCETSWIHRHMPKNIVICRNGNGNEIEGNPSNVLKLYRITRRDPEQRVY